MTPLSSAFHVTSLKLLKWLVNNGANPNHLNFMGLPLIYIPLISENQEMVTY